ncbi:MAG TPA: delta-60 repeat domain-containing protein, partial [Blastocatellia bacterium]|nr:delta-60 repeat domain-containing protein [Blastocatellia bacterium]
IVVAGEKDFNAPDRSFALARFNSDGSLDNSFGSEGKVTTDFSGQRCEAYSIVLQPDGKIIAAGYSTQTTRPTHILAMARYNSDGSLDRSFGNGGKVSNDFFGRGGEAHTVALQRDGKIIVGATAGYSAAGSPNVDYAVLRYNKDGSLDSSFDGGGIAITDCGDIIDSPYVMAIQPDGKIILGGTSGDQQSRADMVIVRYNNTSAPFDTCIQDDSSGNLLQFNSTTGAYQFTVCATGFTLSGQGTVSVKGCKMKLQAAAADRNLTVTIQTCKGKASAQIDALAEVQIYHITDSSIANNTCGCH